MASGSAARTADPPGHGLRITPAGWCRFAVRLALLLVLLLACTPIHYLWRALRFGSPWPQLFLRAAARIIGARVRVAGTMGRRDTVFVANHLSWLDIPVLGGATGTAFVAKAEVAAAPVVGWLARINRTVFVNRDDRMNVGAQVDAVRLALLDTWSIAIFPEGTTGGGAALLPFKSAMLAILEPPPPGVRVQPVRIDYGAATPDIAWIGDEPGQANAARILARRGGFDVTLTFLEPFDPADFPGRKAIAAEARARIERFT